jgi:trans-aconitate methyltransferase
MGIIGRQFGRPAGLLGGVAGRFMARNNGALNARIVQHLARDQSRPSRLIELGPGPGVGTSALLGSFPTAEIVAVEPSPVMRTQLARRNHSAIEAGRLRVIEGTLTDLDGDCRADAVLAVHVVYFWADLTAELRLARDHLTEDGVVALGYQLGEHMPRVARRDFPASGHHLVESDAELAAAMESAGLVPEPVHVFGEPNDPLGRLMLARPHRERREPVGSMSVPTPLR